MKIGIIGCGSMGRALSQVLSKKHHLWFIDTKREKAELLAKEFNGSTEIPKVTDMAILAIKPQEFKSFQLMTEPHLLVSILTGVSYAQLKKKFAPVSILRMMPNLAVRYGQGVVALAEDSLLDKWRGEIEMTFKPLGLVEWFPEEMFDAVTSLTGSGPAFVYAIIEAMIEAGEKMGLEKKRAYELVLQMMSGSIATLEAADVYPAELIPLITSPGGTTLAGLEAFKSKDGREAIVATFEAACRRSRELGQR